MVGESWGAGLVPLRYKEMMGVMKMRCMAVGRWMMSVALVMSVLGVQPVAADDASGVLPGITMTDAKISNLMSQGDSCAGYKWNPTITGFCCLPTCPHKPNNCCTGYENSSQYKIEYWEPSAIIEVSCRSGYSMLAPGKVKSRGDTSIQSCIGFNKPGNSRWFFEARVWAIDGYNGGLRHQAMGGTMGEKLRQCTEAAGDDTTKNNQWGYGIKWGKFTPGAANGPGGSWEAYISDQDKTWADNTGTAPQTTPSACNIGGVDLANCWGPMANTGWVVQTNPTIAAALVAWRAHSKALAAKKVSPAGQGGFKMDMDFPFTKYGGDYAASMGFKNGGKGGSACFTPGDSGPTWFNGQKPEEMSGFVHGLKNGTVSSEAQMNSGIYIFTVWVHTSCTRWSIKAHKPTPLCFYHGID